MFMSNSLQSFVGFGSDTDCDGTSYYACGVLARDEDHAWEVLREDFGGMTGDGVYAMMSYTDALREDDRVRGIMTRTFANYGEEPTPFRYTSLGADWAPWAGPDGDDSIGIPALDSTYDEPMLNWE
jgi:hypothetical protein